MQITDDDSGILLTNGRGVILEANPRACSMFGYAREQLVYTNVIKLLHADEVKKILRRRESPSLWATLAAARQMVRQDDEVITIEVSSRIIHKGKQMLVLRDLTEQRRVEELIKATNQRLLDILDSISDSFMVLGTDWRFKYINKRAATLIGVNTAEILNESIWEQFPGLLGTPFEKNYRKAMRERVSVFFEAETPEGRWIEVRVYPTAEGLTIYGSDVTERKRAEERLLFALESARLMVVEWTDENGESPVKKGWSAPLEPIHPEDRARVAEERRRAAERGGDSTLEFRLMRPDGSCSWVSDRVRVTHGHDGEVTRITDVFVDITERKRLEEELRELRRRGSNGGPREDEPT